MPRTALVTGGASGLGAATAARLRADGLTVTTLDVSGPAEVTADVTDEAALRQIARKIGPIRRHLRPRLLHRRLVPGEWTPGQGSA